MVAGRGHGPPPVPTAGHARRPRRGHGALLRPPPAGDGLVAGPAPDRGPVAAAARAAPAGPAGGGRRRRQPGRPRRPRPPVHPHDVGIHRPAGADRGHRPHPALLVGPDASATTSGTAGTSAASWASSASSRWPRPRRSTGRRPPTGAPPPTARSAPAPRPPSTSTARCGSRRPGWPASNPATSSPTRRTSSPWPATSPSRASTCPGCSRCARSARCWSPGPGTPAGRRGVCPWSTCTPARRWATSPSSVPSTRPTTCSRRTCWWRSSTTTGGRAGRVRSGGWW